MATWPSIAIPSFGWPEKTYLPQIRNEFEANYVQTRPACTRARGQWALRWNAMSNADYETLKTFFKANQGSSFTWPHPVTSVSHTCIFSGDSLDGTPIERDADGIVWQVNCPIEEV